MVADRRRAIRHRRGDPKLAIAYCRVSTDLDRQELGAEAQRSAIEAWANREKVSISAWYVEEASGGVSLDRRPIFLEAIAATAVHGAGSLVVQRLDRFSRDGLTAALAEAELQRNGATLAIADGAGGGTDPTAALIRGILLSVAQFEKAMIRARIVAALAVKQRRGELTGTAASRARAGGEQVCAERGDGAGLGLTVKQRRGELTGTAPFGFKVGADGKTLEPDSRERAIRERLCDLRRAGLTVRAIATCAANEGILNRAGKPFAVAAVHVLVRDILPQQSLPSTETLSP
jgi:DNA invertase Pin-like site-specific DNA recombinase